MPALKELAQRFHEHLYATKQATALLPGLEWYPWASLGQFDILDGFLRSDPQALLDLIGNEPVLDVGCGDGDVAFFLESLGARVDAIDFGPTNYNALYGIRTLKEKLASNVEIQAVDLDTRPHLPKPHYGLTVMLGVLYHLKNPFLVLETLARHSRRILLSTRIAALAPDRQTRLGGLPVAYLVEEDELNRDDTNYWIFAEEGLKRIVHRAGWDVKHYATSGPAERSDPISAEGDARAFLLAESRLAAKPCAYRLLDGWHELEHGSWRWTARSFSLELTLAEPRPAATLRFLFRLPDMTFASHDVLRLNARVNGIALPPATFRSTGENEYLAPTPALPAGPARIEFELDHAIPPNLNDQRELGVLVDLSGDPAVTLE